MNQPYFISAIGTPLDDDESLHVEGLRAHLEDQWAHGIHGVLVAGTMGLMQLLRDQTYEALARSSVEMTAGKGEVMIGAGDCSYARTRDRIQFLNTLKIDAVVVLTPYFVRFSQPELVEYYTALADQSRAPLYLYDLPQRTGSKIEMSTARALAKHSNIAGIKCSDEPAYARQLRDELPERFRVVIAQPALVDVLLRSGLNEHLDGMYAIAPQWALAIGRHAVANDWQSAARAQQDLNHLRDALAAYGAFQFMTDVLNARGIPGNFAPRPFRKSTPEQREKILAEPIVRRLIESA